MGLTWELIGYYPEDSSTPYEMQRRAKVYGGWLVKTEGLNEVAVAMAFVPDENHVWVV